MLLKKLLGISLGIILSCSAYSFELYNPNATTVNYATNSNTANYVSNPTQNVITSVGTLVNLKTSGTIINTHTSPYFLTTETLAPANSGLWVDNIQSQIKHFSTWDDTTAINRDYLTVTRGTVNVTAIELGNATDRPPVAFNGVLNTKSNWISGDGGLEGIYVSSNGYVGVGTNNPQTTLQALGNSGDGQSFGIFSFDTNSASNNVGVKVGAVAGAGATGYGFMQAKHTGIASDANLILNPINGNIGIGLTTPSVKLEVNGTVSANSYGAITVLTATSNMTGVTSSTTCDLFYYKAGKQVTVYIRFSGTNTDGAINVTGLPAAYSSLSQQCGIMGTVDNSQPAAAASCRILAGTTTLNFFKDTGFSAFTGAGSCSVNGSFTYITN